MNIMTQAHLEGLYIYIYMQMHRDQEGIQNPSRNSDKWMEGTALHNPLPQPLTSLQGESRLKQQKPASCGRKQVCPHKYRDKSD